MAYHGRTDLYRLYDGQGQLLYLGIAQSVEKRFEEHSLRGWWGAVTRVSLVPYPTRREALAAEAAAVRAENPRYNIVHAVDPELARAAEERDWELFGREATAAARQRYVLWPKHHIYDLLAQAGRKGKRFDVPQSYHSDPNVLAALDEYDRRLLERIKGLSRQEIYDMYYG